MSTFHPQNYYFQVTLSHFNFNNVRECSDLFVEKGWELINYSNQRIISPEYVQELISDIISYLNQYGKCYSLGSIVFAKMGSSIYLIDGQHRLEAIKQLNQGVEGKRIFFPFHVQVNEVDSMEEIDHLFVNLNKGLKPPEEIINNLELSQLTNEIHTFLRELNGNVFVSSQKASYRPKIKIEVFTNSFFESTWGKDCKTSAGFFEIYNYYNDLHRQWLAIPKVHERRHKTRRGNTQLKQETIDKIVESGIYFSLVGDGDYFPAI